MMFSKFLRLSLTKQILWSKKSLNIQPCPLVVHKTFRKYSDYIPPTQYDLPTPRTLRIGYVLRVYWETIPLFVSTAIAMGAMIIATIWACQHKVDVVYTTHSRENISRTMDLRNPSIHKMRLINQRYLPWPEMQDVLDKMRSAEKRAIMRAESCSNP